MNNAQIAETFENIAGLLEMKGEKVFTIRAYQRAARTIERLPMELQDMLRDEQDLRDDPRYRQGYLRKDRRDGRDRLPALLR